MTWKCSKCGCTFMKDRPGLPLWKKLLYAGEWLGNAFNQSNAPGTTGTTAVASQRYQRAQLDAQVTGVPRCPRCHSSAKVSAV